MVIIPYKFGSNTAKLFEAEGIKRYSRKKLKRPSADVIINWGCTSLPWEEQHLIRNCPMYVDRAANKVSAFDRMSGFGINVPLYTTDRLEASKWEGTVYCRYDVNGYGGKGIIVVEKKEIDLPDCPLYTLHVPSTHEYRVHVAFGNVISLQQKRRRKGTQPTELIRNLENGWVFCRNEIDDPPRSVLHEARDAVVGLSLDFGAVDILWNSNTNIPTVLEVNTAPGLMGTTLQDYIEAFKEVNG